MKKAIVAVVVIILVALGAYFLLKTPKVEPTPEVPVDTQTPGGVMETGETPVVDKTQSVIGNSVGGRQIMAYHFGEGSQELVFVGGIHGGYEWNTVLVAYELADYLKANPDVIPKNVKVTVIPTLNPDGLNKVIGKDGRFMAADVNSSQTVQVSGRFNANTVDLNRNFDCEWKKEGKWQNKTVSGGDKAFSEPESQAMKNYIEANNPDGVVVWYSAAGGVYASNCHEGVLPGTTKMMNTFAKASGYPAHNDFNFYEITGDMVNWLASKKIPAISVLLTNHTDTEWSKNKAGVEALLKQFAE